MLSLQLLLLLTLPAVVQAQFNYTTNNGTITITGYTGPGGAVTIPDTINGLPVTSIGDYAFNGKTSLTSVAIPNSVTSIGNQVFYSCTGLTGVTVPGSVTNIGFYAFASCTSLSAITVDALNSVYGSVDGVLFNKNQTFLIQYPPAKSGSDYTIPNSVTSIGSGAFFLCTSLTSVTIPNNVTDVNDAFASCYSLTSVTIGTNVTRIGDHAFHGCYSLTSVTIPNSVTSIGVYAFASCYSLTSVTIGNGVTNIASGAFSQCTSLTNITIPNSVISLGAAFLYCPSLTSVTIGNGVTSIGDLAFASCASLMAITVDALNSAYSSVDGILFNKSQTLLIVYPGGKAGSYTIPDSVTNIGNFAFYECTSLTSVTIPSSVTSIGYDAFYYCTSLRGVYFQGNAPSVGVNVFYGANNAIVYYLPGTTGWGTTFAGPAVLWNPLMQTGDASFGVRTNRFGFTITGASNLVLVVEAATNLAHPAWIPVGTNTLTGGASDFSDPQWTNYPARFYRLRSP